MNAQSLVSFYNIIGLSIITIVLIVITRLVIYLRKRMWYKKKCKLVWTPISSIDHRSNLSYEEFIREYASVGKPAIITDAMKNWKASTKWNMDFFRSEYGSVKHRVVDCTDGTFVSMTMTIADYIDYMTAGDRDKLLQLGRFPVYNHPELLEDYEEPVYFSNWFRKKLPLAFNKKYLSHASRILIGQKDTSTELHCDSGHHISWVAVVSGRKQVVLFSPDQKDFLYSIQDNYSESSQVNCFNPDLEKFPLYAKAEPVECIVNQGEILYIPPDWWHQVKNIEDTIALVTNVMNEWNCELVYQACLEEKGLIKGHIFPLILEFPWLGRVLFAIGLI